MRQRSRLVLPTLAATALAVGLLATGVAPAAATTGQPAGADLVPAKGLLFGSYVQPRPGQGAEAAAAEQEAIAGRKMDLQRIYRQWDDPQPDPVVVASLRRGRIPVLSIRPRYKDGRIVPWAAVARGDADATIVKQADGLRSLPGTLFLAFHHEPDDVSSPTAGSAT